MKYLFLMWKGILRKPGRALLTLFTIFCAFVLLSFLQAFRVGFDSAVDQTNADVLISYSSVSQFDRLPIAHVDEISSIPGVSAATPAVIFESTYQSPTQFVRAFAVEPEGFLSIYPDMGVTSEQIASLSGMRRGALVSQDVATQFGWKIGDEVPLQSVLWRNADGSSVFNVNIVGIYQPKNGGAGGNPMLLNYGYVDEARAAGKGSTNFVFFKLNDPQSASRISSEVDGLFANSAYKTRTVTESQLARDSLRSIGDLGVIINAVSAAILIALLFTIGSAIWQSVRDRTAELAVMKALGFEDYKIVLLIVGETVILCLAGAASGYFVASFFFSAVEVQMGLSINPAQVLLLSMGIALALAVISSLLPALRAMRLQIVTAFAEGGL